MARKRNSYRRSGRGSLLLISCFLLGSAAIRVGGEAGKAAAIENPFPAEAVSKSENDPIKAAPETESLTEMLSAFQRREERILRREREIDIRQKALRVADEEIEKRLVVLQEAEESLRALLSLADTAAENDLNTLTSVYENMKPKNAAALFEEMEPAFAAGFLGRMRPNAAAGIMAGLSPDTAYSISVILAGRNADVPKE